MTSFIGKREHCYFEKKSPFGITSALFEKYIVNYKDYAKTDPSHFPEENSNG
jgi:hypothetical protein